MSQKAKPRLLFLAGSLRRDSYQRRLLGYLAPLCDAYCEIDIVQHGDISLPLFDQDLEYNPSVMRDVLALYARIKRADGFVVASPEHNSQVSAFLKNTVDWVSRAPQIVPSLAPTNAFHNKPVLLTSASTGWTGGVVGLQGRGSSLPILVPLSCRRKSACRMPSNGSSTADSPSRDHLASTSNASSTALFRR